MLKEVKMFTVICDNCGADSNKGSEYSCWGDSSNAEDIAADSDWHFESDKHYCPNCFSFDDNDKLVIDPIRKVTLPSPLSVDELKQKFAQHLGVPDLDTTDAYAIEWAVKNYLL